MAQMNWLAVLVAAFVGFLVASFWYGPLFGRSWLRVAGVRDQGLDEVKPEVLYGGTLFLSLISAIFVGHLLANFPGRPAHVYLMITSGIGVGFIFPALAIRSLHSRKSPKMLLIDSIGWILYYLAMGAVFILLG
ncbi:MAG TPA: DUF1761 domain-containing protein [Sphingopyxis sp.]|nr:DUF1761 domain-containing protein [Sphingopyxis sp.]